MNVYLYIAESDPDAAYQICQKYGYFDLRSIDDLSNCLSLIVAQNGENAFNEIMQLHPEVIGQVLDKNTPSSPPPPPTAKSLDGGMVEVDPNKVVAEKEKECSCNKNAAGDTTTPLVNHTNLYILIGALVISMAIVVSIKKT